jgi:hypothetical protein
MRTDADVRADSVRVMGDDLGNFYHELRRDFEWLKSKWMEFGQLFLGGEERLEVLKEVAPAFFFNFLLNLLYEDMMLHLSRLTDSPQSMGQENLTVLGLSAKIRDPELGARVQAAADMAKNDCGFARGWRHKRLAHTDLSSLRTGYQGFPSVHEENIKTAIHSLHTALGDVGEYFRQAPVLLIQDPWGASALVCHLEKTTSKQVTG